MAEKQQATFEQKVARLETIVKELEQGNVELERTVELFKEGKALAAECEKLLQVAQEQISRTMEQAAGGADDEVAF